MSVSAAKEKSFIIVIQLNHNSILGDSRVVKFSSVIVGLLVKGEETSLACITRLEANSKAELLLSV
ncbi:hypothetical protein M445_16925 [Vibrio owensii 47666-1]|nr:hypothetical protein M445_16925 [Vibrio owensii 47666-1]